MAASATPKQKVMLANSHRILSSHISHRLNSSQEVIYYIGDYKGIAIWVIKGDTWSLDYGSHGGY